MYSFGLVPWTHQTLSACPVIKKKKKKKVYLSYSNFKEEQVTEQYPLTISGLDDVNVTTDPFYTIEKSSWSLNGSQFTTRERGSDECSSNYACSTQL